MELAFDIRIQIMTYSIYGMHLICRMQYSPCIKMLECMSTHFHTFLRVAMFEPSNMLRTSSTMHLCNMS